MFRSLSPTTGNRTVPLIFLGLVILASIVALLVTHLAAQSSVGEVDADGIPLGPISAAYVSSRPDAHLTFPGAMVFHTEVVSEAPPSRPGSTDFQVARVDQFTATTATPLQVREWFSSALSAAGYECYRAAEPSYVYTMDSYVRSARQVVFVGYVNPYFLRIAYGFIAPCGGRPERGRLGVESRQDLRG
jgi:hypothetical protein